MSFMQLSKTILQWRGIRGKNTMANSPKWNNEIFWDIHFVQQVKPRDYNSMDIFAISGKSCCPLIHKSKQTSTSQGTSCNPPAGPTRVHKYKRVKREVVRADEWRPRNTTHRGLFLTLSPSLSHRGHTTVKHTPATVRLLLRSSTATLCIPARDFFAG